MKKFTFIAEYKKGTYISQYESSNLMEALVIWADNLDIQFFTEKVKQYKTNQHVFIRKAPK